MLDVLIDGQAAASARTSGWERYTRLLVEELGRDSRGLRVDVATPPAGVGRPRWEHDRLPRLARSCRLLHLPAAPPSPLVRRPTLTTVHDATLLFHPEWCSRGGRWYYRHATRRLLRRPGSWIVTDTDGARADLLLAGADAASTFVARLGLARPSPRDRSDPTGMPVGYEHLGVAPGTPFLLHVGTVEPRKNIATLLTAWQRAAWAPLGQRPMLVLCGRHGWGPRPPLPGGVVATGPVPDAELRALLTSATALVTTSAYEGFGLPLLEALAVGLVTVASDIPAHREVGGDAPVYVPAHDPDAIADAIRLVIGFDADERARRAALGRRRAEKLDLRRFGDEVAAVYRAVLGR